MCFSYDMPINFEEVVIMIQDVDVQDAYVIKC